MTLTLKKRKKFQLLFFTLLLTVRVSAATIRLSEVLQQDLQEGKISYAQFLGYQLLAAEQPESLPMPYQKCDPIFSQSLTALAAQARALLAELSGSDRDWLASLLQRPDSGRLPMTLISPSKRFKIHYTTTGFDSCSHEYAQAVAEAYDYVYQFEVEQLGFAPPPDDQGIDGPEYDIYIVSFTPYYGETIFENPVPGSEGNTYTSFSKIDRNFDDPRYFTRGLDAMHVTAAHEFFHMIQGGYRFFPTTKMNSVFLFEASSVWMEEMAFPQVNDYLQYVRTFMQFPTRAFHMESNSYGLCLYIHMLTKRFGTQVVNRIWDAFRTKEPLDAIDAGLKKDNESFERSLAQFTTWNCFTAEWADSINYYHEGHLYPRMMPMSRYQLEEDLSITGSCSELVSHYYRIAVTRAGRYHIKPQLESPADWMYSVVVQQPNGKADTYCISGDEPVSLQDVAAESEIWLNATNINRPQNNYSNHPLKYAFAIEQGSAIPIADEGIVAIYPTPFKLQEHQALEIQYRFATEQPSVELYIFNENGLLVFHTNLGRVSKGLNRYFWYGRNAQGHTLSTGVYLCLIRGEELLKPQKFIIIR